MKTIFCVNLLLIASVGILSCKKDNPNAPEIRLNEMVDTTAMLLHSGTFTSGPYGTVTGMAEVYMKGRQFEIKLANFNTTNGPALHVYLSKEAMPVNYMDLGVLKSTGGNQVYNISGMPDFTEYKFVSIHCVDFNHLFGAALLN